MLESYNGIEYCFYFTLSFINGNESFISLFFIIQRREITKILIETNKHNKQQKKTKNERKKNLIKQCLVFRFNYYYLLLSLF